jgi:hypothetical protein
MSIPTIYIRGTKKAANEQLAAGKQMYGIEYSLYAETDRLLTAMPDGTVIKFWTKRAGGTPIAASYGNWRPAKNKIV